jgi:uncharacterized membrane protein
MSGQGRLMTGVVVGAGTMYLLDPDRGAHRRTLLRNQGVHAGRRVKTELVAKTRHAGKQIQSRLVLGAAGGLLAVRGARKGGAMGVALGLAGVGLLARAVIPGRTIRLLREATEQSVELETMLPIGAPLEAVWELWSNFENFPRFMAHLSDVRKIDEGHSHWVAHGPAGVPVEWDAVVTDWVPQQFIGWSSLEASPVRTSGQVRLRRTGDRVTETDVRLVFAFRGAGVGQSITSLLGADPERALHDDLGRLKSLLEQAQEALPPTRTRRPPRRRAKPKS